MTLEDAISLVSARALILNNLETGAMLSVALGAAEVAEYLRDGVELSAINAPEASTLAGDPVAIEQVRRRLEDAGIAARVLPTDRAFHSWMMAPAVPRLVEFVSTITLQPPRIPCISNVTGDWLSVPDSIDPKYWGRHLRLPVRFAAGAATLCSGAPAVLLLEIGAGHSLGSFVRQAGFPAAGTVSTLPAYYERDDGRQVLEAIVAAWLAGVVVSWPQVPGRRRVALPTHPSMRVRDLPKNPRLPSEPNIIEQELVELLRELLRVAEVDRNDSFFELGGNSLSARQLLSRIHMKWKVDLPLRRLFVSPIVAELAIHIEEALVAEIEREGDKGSEVSLVDPS
jgi:acyl transferase domain-containing protein